MERGAQEMKRFLRSATVLGTVLAVAVLGACSGGGDATDDETTAAPVGGGGEVKIAIVLKTLTSEFWQSMKTGAEEKADELGIQLDVYAANSEDDVEGQVALVENAISQGYDAIGVAPISNVNLNNVVAQATAAGIYVVNVDEAIDLENLVGLGGAVQAFVTTDNVAVGNMAGEFIVEAIGGSGQVAIIEGKAGVASGEARKQGASEAFDAAGLELVDSQPADWDRTKAFDLATNYLSKYPDLKAIYCANDTMAMGAQEAVASSGRDVVVVGTDGNSDAIESVEAGGLGATVKQDSAGVGAKAVELLNDLASAGGDIDPNAEVEQIRVDAILVTKS